MPELIDRNELRKDFCNMCEAMQPEMIDCEKKGCMSMQIIDEQPTIEAEPVRHGRWNYVGEKTMHDGWTYRKHKCSECGFWTVEVVNFCPNCGARMDGGADI